MKSKAYYIRVCLEPTDRVSITGNDPCKYTVYLLEFRDFLNATSKYLERLKELKYKCYLL